MTIPEKVSEPRKRSRLLRGLLIVVVLFGLLAIAVMAWLRSDGARLFAARQLESIVDQEIRGRMSIGSIDSIDQDGVEGTDIVFYDELDAPVLEAEKVALVVDWWALLQGRFLSKAGNVHGGRLSLDVRPDGSLSISHAFESAHPGGQEGQPIGEDVVRLEHLDIAAIELGMSVEGTQAFRANNLRALVNLRLPENGAIVFGAERVRGRLHMEGVVPVDLSLRTGEIALDGAADDRAQITLLTRVGGEGVRIRADVTAGGDDNMRIGVRLHPESAGAVFTAGHLFTQALALGAASDVIDVDVDL